MDKLFSYEPDKDRFIELIAPVQFAAYEYQVYFSIYNREDSTPTASHYIFCKSFNDLVTVLAKLRAVLNNSNTRSHYTYLGPALNTTQFLS